MNTPHCRASGIPPQARSIKPPQTTSNHLKQQQPHQTTSNNLKQPQTTSNNFKQLQTTSNNFKPNFFPTFAFLGYMAEPGQVGEVQEQRFLIRFWNALRKLWRKVENVVFALVTLLIILYFLLQLPVVQNWLVRKATTYCSELLGAKVEIRHVDIAFFDNIILDGAYVEDLTGDTLLYAAHLRASLTSNFFTAFYNRLSFDEIELRNARLNVIRPVGQYETNLDQLLAKIPKSSKDKKTPKAAFLLKVRRLKLDDVIAIWNDQVKGRKMRAVIPKGQIQVNAIDFPTQTMDIQSIKLNGLGFDYEEHPGNPLPPRPEKPKTPKDSSAAKPLIGKVDLLEINNAWFEMDRFRSSPSKQTAEKVFDKNHIRVNDLQIQARALRFDDKLSFEGVLDAFSAKEQCGFEFKQASASRFVVNDSLTGLYGVKLSTPGTTLGDTIALQYHGYKSYLHFEEEVNLDLRFGTGAKLRIGDIAHFSGALDRSAFMQKNRDLIAEISGHYHGKIAKKLRGDAVSIRVGDHTVIEGSFRAEGLLGGPDPRILGVKFKRLETNFTALNRIIPGFKTPSAFNSLGKSIRFSGDYQMFDGFDHIIHGDISTGIGSGEVDLNLNLEKGLSNALYSGYIDMKNLDLGAWTGNHKDFGKTSFKVNIAPGSTGLTLPTVKAALDGNISYLEYRGYKYQNVKMDGSFREYVFDGKLGIKDPNIIFNFDGNVNLKDSIPQFLFNAQLTRLDAGALNLLDEDWIVSGNMEQMRLSGASWRDLVGSAAIKNIRILEIGESANTLHVIDSLNFASSYHADGSNLFQVKSSLFDGELKGRFDLSKVLANLRNLFSRYHPEWAERMGLPSADSVEITDNFELNFYVKNLRDLPQLLHLPVDSIYDVPINARVDGPRGLSELRIKAPEIKTGRLLMQNVGLRWFALKENAQLYLDIPQGKLGKTKLAPVNIQGFLSRDELEFNLNAEDSLTEGIVKAVNLNAALTAIDSSWQIKFGSSDIALFNENWTMSNKNYIRFRKNYIETKDFEFFSGNRRIQIDSMNSGRGLKLSLTNFGVDFINNFISPKKAKFEGNIYDFELSIADLFKMKGLHAGIGTGTVSINGTPYGAVDAYVDMDSLDTYVSWDAYLNYKNQKMQLTGAYLPDKLQALKLADKDFELRPGEFQNRVYATDFPMEVLETFVPGISGTKGKIDADVLLSGRPNRIGMKGEAWVSGKTQLDFLKASFYVDSQRVELTNYKIWATGGVVWDGSPKRLHAARVRGGIKHDHFKKWELDCDLRTEDKDFLVMNTQKTDNSLYYGTGRGSFEAKFRGTFSRTNISVDAVTGKETRLYIPLTTAEDIGEVKFITFTNNKLKDTLKTQLTPAVSKELKGLNFEMNLTMTKDAEVQMIFDEEAGDIIIGRGEGDLKLIMNREGEFKMYGGYTISSGEYLFTLLNLVNKPFKVKQGGTISWFGDPYSAQIDLDATYEENTTPYNFIRDELLSLGTQDPEVSETANKSTRILVTMHLKGELFKPGITFDLEFPNLTGKLKTLTDNRLRTVRQDQNELSRQVFGLIVAGSFLPASNQFIQGADYTASAVNTLTQMLSSQLSRYLTGLATEYLGGTFSSLNFNIVYNEYNSGTENISTQPDREFQLRLSGAFKNERILFQAGSQFGVGRPGADVQEGFLGEDVVIELLLTPNRRWRLKVFQRLEPGYDGGRRISVGGGLSFRRDYDSFEDMSKGLKSWFVSKKRKS